MLHNCARQTPPAPQRLGPRLRQPADGPVERDLSRAAARCSSPSRSACRWRCSARSTALPKPPRRSPSSPRAACQRPQPPPQAVDPRRLRARGAVETVVPAGVGAGRSDGRALRRPPRQGHSRRAPRRHDRRRDAARNPRPRLRPAPVARHGRGADRADRRGRADGAVRRQHPRGVLDRGDPGAAVLPARLAGAQGEERSARRPAVARPSSPASASSTGRRAG